MPDYIEREAAKEAVVKAVGKGYSPFNAIVMLPAADVRPVVRGGWEEHGEPNEHGKYELWYYSCTRCGAVGIPQYNFCPNCGADMRPASMSGANGEES